MQETTLEIVKEKVYLYLGGGIPLNALKWWLDCMYYACEDNMYIGYFRGLLDQEDVRACLELAIYNMIKPTFTMGYPQDMYTTNNTSTTINYTFPIDYKYSIKE